jgi:PAP2 superfamily
MARLKGEWRWLAPLMGITAILLVLGQVVGLWFDSRPFSVMSQYAMRIVILAPFMAIAGAAVLLIAFALRREKQPTRAALQFIRSRFATPGSAFAVGAAVLMIPILMGSFGTLKMMMPLMRPFNWDPALAAADRLLFFGVDPWRITHAVLGSPTATRAIDVLYGFWVPFVMIGVLAAAMSPAVVRARYFLSFGAAWFLIGTIGAYLLASAGPCFVDRLGIDTASAFQPLMQHLRYDYEAVGGINAITWQDTLWHAYSNREYGFARGISAAPSMHNAICMLYVLALWNSLPVLRAAAIAFAAVIFVGSVHLGWHYAIDGLLGFAAMIAIWKFAGFYLDWCGYTAPGEAPATDSIPNAEPEPIQA